MPASPISKEMDVLPDHWVHLQKTMIPDSATSCYWSVWYNPEGDAKYTTKATAWLMWCPFGDDPSVNDSWGHAEEIDESCRNVLYAIESVWGVSFHESIWVEMGATEVFPAMSEIRKSCGEPDGIGEYCSGAPHIESCPLYKPIIPSGSVAIGKGETWDGE